MPKKNTSHALFISVVCLISVTLVLAVSSLHYQVDFPVMMHDLWVKVSAFIAQNPAKVELYLSTIATCVFPLYTKYLRDKDKRILAKGRRILRVLKTGPSAESHKALQEAPQSLLASRKFSLAAVKASQVASVYMSKAFWNDFEVVESLVKQDGLMLESASAALKKNPVLVLLAVR